MELCRASLDQLFFNNEDKKKYWGPVPLRYQVLTQLADGLKYIHGQELKHGNIEPSNVLVWIDPDTEAKPMRVVMKWANLGAYKSVKESSSRTPKDDDVWLAPEVRIRNGSQGTQQPRVKCTKKSDVFSLGLVYGYFLLNGEYPLNINEDNMSQEDEYEKSVTLKGNVIFF